MNPLVREIELDAINICYCVRSAALVQEYLSKKVFMTSL